MNTMHALRAHERGGPERLVDEEAPLPEPGPGDVVVQVYAAAITFTELGWDETWLKDEKSRTPVIPSHEASGRVVATRPSVVDVAVGDEVFGLVPFDRDGAAAEFVALPAANVARSPSGDGLGRGIRPSARGADGVAGDRGARRGEVRRACADRGCRR